MSRVVVSVQHTGSRFLCERLGIHTNDIIHTNQPLTSVIEKIDGRDIITPLRHPKDVWHSWCKRGKADSNLFLFSWARLNTLCFLTPIDFIAVDKQEDSRITDWTKVCHNPKEAECPEVDLRGIMKMPFIRGHYYAN